MVIILCAGNSERWTHNTPKQLVTVDGEKLLTRTMRQFPEGKIITDNQKIKEAVDNIFVPDSYIWTLDTLESTIPLWDSNRLIVLLGDVYYSDAAVETISKSEQDIQYYGKGSGKELFAITVNAKGLKRFKNTLLIVNSLARSDVGKEYKPKLKDILAVNSRKVRGDVASKYYTPIDDETDDFDRYEEYINWIKKYNK